MPRYRYNCIECKVEKIIFHLFEEIPNLDCEGCNTENSLQKMVTSPMYALGVDNTAPKVGDVTEEYIEKNREVLKQEKKRIKELTYEPT